MKKLIIFFLFLAIMLFFGYYQSFAASEGVLINEIAWMGTEASTNDEWIELFNTTADEVDLSGWILVAEDDTPLIELQGKIAPGGFFLLERSDDQTVSDVMADQIYSGALGNNGEYLFLKNNLGQIIDEVDASLGWPAGSNEPIKISMARGADGSWLNGAAGKSKAKDALGNIINGTPKEANSFFVFPTPALTPTPTPLLTPSPTIVTPTLTPTALPTLTLTPTPTSSPVPTPQAVDYDDIFLNEVMANPSEGSEWVELYNGNDFPVNLENWFLDDLADGGTAWQKFSLTIEPYDYEIISLGKNIFNNTGDDVYLLNFAGEEKDHFSFSKTVVGQSWGKDGDGNWCLQEPTPQKINLDCFSLNQTPTPTLIIKNEPTSREDQEKGEVLGQMGQFYRINQTDSLALKTYLISEESPKPKLKKQYSSLSQENWLPDWLLFSGGLLNFGVGIIRILKKVTP